MNEEVLYFFDKHPEALPLYERRSHQSTENADFFL